MEDLNELIKQFIENVTKSDWKNYNRMISNFINEELGKHKDDIPDKETKYIVVGEKKIKENIPIVEKNPAPKKEEQKTRLQSRFESIVGELELK